MARSFQTAGLFAVLLTGCNESPQQTPRTPVFDVTATPLLSGSVLGRGGSICNSLPAGTQLIIRAFTPGASGFAASAFPICPDNGFAFALASGNYLIRVQLPGDASILGAFPARTITTSPVVLDAQDVVHDIMIQPGLPMGGSVSYDGVPTPDEPLVLTYENASLFAAATGISGADGHWTDFGGRAMTVQPGVRYLAQQDCLAEFLPTFLGTRALQTAPVGGFLFPNEVDRIDCALATAPTTGFSHDRTPLVVTPMPGDIGGLSPELFDQYGAGWGVQLLDPGDRPHHASVTYSQLYRGGLLVALRPERILSGISLQGYADCGSSCRDFGMDATLRVRSTPGGGKRVTWDYSDALSPESAGLKVKQRSYDGGAGYVLFRYTLTNTASATLSYYAGVFMDWDVGNADFDAFDDVGRTDRRGRLMSMSNGDGTGPVDGTLLLGAPIAGTAFLTTFGQSTADLVAAASGDVRTPAIGVPGDYRYIHTVGPIRLRRGQSADVWVAVLSGGNPAAFAASADAATADVARRQREVEDDRGDVQGEGVRSGAHRTQRGRDPRCKERCADRME